jgi:UrcA family protein
MSLIPSLGSPLRAATLAWALCLTGGTGAWAAAPATHSVAVKYADLNLTAAAGADALYRRIKVAAADVCGYEGRSLAEIANWHDCMHGAVADAVAAIDSPLLTARATGKRPVPVTAMLTE